MNYILKQRVTKTILYFLSGSALFTLSSLNAAAQSNGLAGKVNTLIGTKGKGYGTAERYLEAGYTFPGAMYPFGMVQFTPTFFNEDKGFVVNQLSGAGCDHMGNFPTLPLTGELTVSPGSMDNLKPDYKVLKAIAGYYHVNLKDEISAELSVTKRTGTARYHFLQGQKTATVIIGSGVNATKIHRAYIKITSPNSCEGYADGGSFCSPTIPTGYTVYFVARFDQQAVKTGTWKDSILHSGSAIAEGPNSGAFFTFALNGSSTLHYKFAISYVSLENARRNLEAENKDWNFDKISSVATGAWDDYLGRIKVSGGSPDHTVQFYTHLYHALAHPNICDDINGEYIGSDNKAHHLNKGHHYYTSFSNWDTYRTQIQLISMLAPEETSDMVNSIIDFAKRSGGGFPRWVMANIETGIMQGDPTSILVSNAYAFGAKHFDTKAALEIMRRGAEVPGTKSQAELTRPGLEQYLSKGYVGASMSLEYTSADFAIGRFALDAAHDQALYRRYLERSHWWKKLFDPTTGWLRSRNPDGTWKPQGDDWREASYKNYFWMVPYDYKTLIDTIGGPQAASKRLDEFFSELNANYGQQWFAAGNEPDFEVPWVYDWTGEPWKAQQTVRRIINEQYSNRDNGLPGNDDLGAMGAWYVLANIGMYPVIPGVGGFSLNGPSFPLIKMKVGKGWITIKGGSEKEWYIKALLVNGNSWNKTWLPLHVLRNGTTLAYKMSSAPQTDWAAHSTSPSY